jgi:hypothetical protein
VQAGKLSTKDMEECLTAADILRGNLLSFQYQVPQIHKVIELAAAVLEVFESKPSIALMVGTTSRDHRSVAPILLSNNRRIALGCLSPAPENTALAHVPRPLGLRHCTSVWRRTLF